jgi:hypothetical protein
MEFYFTINNVFFYKVINEIQKSKLKNKYKNQFQVLIVNLKKYISDNIINNFINVNKKTIFSFYIVLFMILIFISIHYFIVIFLFVLSELTSG